MKKDSIIVLSLLALVGISVLVVNLFLDENTKINGYRLDIDNGDEKINWNNYPEKNVEVKESLEIKNSGVYRLSGEVLDGKIIVDAGDTSGKVKLVLDNLYVKNSTGPALIVKSADDIVIESLAGTKNFFIDGENYSEEYINNKETAALYSKGDLTFIGDGEIFVTSKNKNGILSRDDLTIRSGTINVEANLDGIEGKDSVHILDGEVYVKSNNDGIKSTNIENAGKGFVLVENGKISLDVEDDGIHATSYLFVKDGEINIDRCYEGLEGNNVAISGGKINIKSSDDGINVAGGNDSSSQLKASAEKYKNGIKLALTISGGDIYVDAGGDGIDSNGDIFIKGGNIVVDGATNGGNGAFDKGENGGFYYDGGEIWGFGWSTMAVAPETNSSVNSLSVYFDQARNAGTKISVKDENGTEILTKTSGKQFTHVVIGSEKLEKGKTYNIYADDELVWQAKIENSTTANKQATQQMEQQMPMGRPEDAMNGGPNGPAMPPDNRR